jgi:hypothetical protein
MIIHIFLSVYSKCFICFRRMLQVFYLDIAKVDLDVAYISVSGVCRCMLQVFHLDVCNDYTRVFKFFCVFASISNICRNC